MIDRCFAGTASRIQGVEFRRPRRRSAAAPPHWAIPAREVDRLHAAAQSGRVPLAGRRRAARVGSASRSPTCRSPPARTAATPTERFAQHVNKDARPRCALARSARVQTRRRGSDSAGGSRTGQRDRQTILHRRDELRIDLRRSPRDAGHRHESSGRQEQHRRGRRRSGPLRTASQRRFQAIGDQAGRLGTIRRHDLVPDQRRRNCRSRSRKVPSRAKAANCRAARSTRTSLASATQTPGVGLISPPPHHDIYSIEDLTQLIHDLKNANPDGSHQRQAGLRSRRRHDRRGRGQGSRRSHPDLRRHRRHRRFAADQHQARRPALGIGHRRNAPDAGAERSAQPRRAADRWRPEDRPRRRDCRAAWVPRRFGFSTAPLITLGCIMMRKCHLNTCPVGIATQDPELRKKFTGKPEHVVNYLFMVAEEARQIMAQLGFRTIARDDRPHAICWKPTHAIRHWKADGLDLTPILTPAHKPHDASTWSARQQARSRPGAGARSTNSCSCAQPALERSEPVTACIADRQHQPHGRHDPQPRSRQTVRRGRAARRHDSHRASPVRPARASAPFSPTASRWSWKAMPTTTSAKDYRADG